MAAGLKALIHAVVYPDPRSEPLRDGVVVIGDGIILDVGPYAAIDIPRDAQAIDCRGGFITAGFRNSHVHFFERKWANAATIPAAELQRQLDEFVTRYGFTSVYDLSSDGENTRRIRARIESGEVHGPRIRTTAEGLLPPGGAAPDLAYHMMGLTKTVLPEVADARSASAVVKRLIDDGADGIKLFVSGPNGAAMSPDAIEGAVNEAHRYGKPVFAHPNTAADVVAALRAGVDVIAHTTPRSPWNDSVVDALAGSSAAITPTLAIWKFFMRHDRASVQDQTRATAADQLRAWRSTGRHVLFGTDLGAVDPDPTDEYVLMHEAGMSFRDILESLTTSPAARFDESERAGRIAKGMRADVIVMPHDPAVDVRALADVQSVYRNGALVTSAASSPASPHHARDTFGGDR